MGKYGGSVYIMITNNASFAPYKLNIVLLIAPQGLQLRIWFKRHVKAGKMPEKMRPALQFYVQSELRSPISPGFPECIVDRLTEIHTHMYLCKVEFQNMKLIFQLTELISGSHMSPRLSHSLYTVSGCWLQSSRWSLSWKQPKSCRVARIQLRMWRWLWRLWWFCNHKGILLSWNWIPVTRERMHPLCVE